MEEERSNAESITIIPPSGGDSPETSSIPSGSGQQPPEAAESSSGEKGPMTDITYLLTLACEGLISTNYNVEEAITVGDAPVPLNDITYFLSLACKDLGNGELIHGEDFDREKVLEACHSTFPGLISTQNNFKEAITGCAAPVSLSSDKTEDALCVIEVMDHILTCEATWHVRATMLETLGSCFYMWKPEILLSHPLLNAFFRVVKLTCDAIHPLLTMFPKPGDIPKSYYRSLETSEAKESLALLSATEGSFWKLQIQTNPGIEGGIYQALTCRLRFHKQIFSILSCMRKPRGEGLSLAAAYIRICLDELKLMSFSKSKSFLESKRSSRVSKVGVEVMTTASGFQPVGFESFDSPCAVKLLSWTEAVGYFETLLNELWVICSSPFPSPEDAVRFVTDFYHHELGVVARNHIQYACIPDWTSLPDDLTTNVLNRLGGFEILETAQKVCRSWQVVCRSPSIWQYMDMRNLGNFMPYSPTLLCRKGIILSQKSVIHISIHFFATNDLLVFITRSAPNLKVLTLHCCPYVSNVWFTRTIKELKSLEEINLFGMGHISPNRIKCVAKTCKELKSINFSMCNRQADEYAIAIAKGLGSKARRIGLCLHGLTPMGVTRVIQKCPSLEELKLDCSWIQLQQVVADIYFSEILRLLVQHKILLKLDRVRC